MPRRDLPPFRDLRGFISYLEERGELVRIREPVSVVHEITEIHRRTLQAGGPALLFESPVLPDGAVATMPVLVNLFGTRQRVAWGFGVESDRINELGDELAALREPRPPRDFADVMSKLPLARAAMLMRPKQSGTAPVQEVVFRGDTVDLSVLPAQVCWPGEPGPLITWPLVITRPPDGETDDETNVGVYRMQVIGRDRVILRWLAHRGGARHHHRWKARGSRHAGGGGDWRRSGDHPLRGPPAAGRVVGVSLRGSSARRAPSTVAGRHGTDHGALGFRDRYRRPDISR